MIYEEYKDTDYYNEPRYQDTLTHDQFSLVVSTGPMWNRLATRFRTPYNHDLVHWREGPAGNFFTSNDGGHWWFRAAFMPLKITWDKSQGYRLNATDPWVERNGLTPYARMITKAFPAVQWPDAADVPVRNYTAHRTECRLLSPKQAFDAGYGMTSTDEGFVFSQTKLPPGLVGDPFQSTAHFPHANGTFDSYPHFWLPKPIPPVLPPPEPVESDYQYTYETTTVTYSEGPPASVSTSTTSHTVTLGLYATEHAQWQALKNAYDAALAQYNLDLAAWNDWKSKTPIYVLIRDGRVRNILSSTAIGGDYLLCGLAPFYDDTGVFVGWAAAQEKRVVLTYDGTEVAGEWLPYGTGIMSSLKNWNERDIGEWVPAPDDFDFNKDPRFQGPF